MKSTSITFITFNSINKHLSHVSQMHIHAYIQKVHDLEPYSGKQGRHECLWTLVDPDMYMRHVDIFSLFSMFLLSYFFPKDIIIPYIIDNHMTDFSIIIASCMTSPPYILLFTPHSPVICKDNFPLVYMYKLSRYYTVFQSLIWVLYSLGQPTPKS